MIWIISTGIVSLLVGLVAGFFVGLRCADNAISNSIRW
jgi:uncharacterized protein YneF (UPF0154 family)